MVASPDTAAAAVEEAAASTPIDGQVDDDEKNTAPPRVSAPKQAPATPAK